MENVILVVHLILALCLIGVVLLQRSEGGGLGMGGGGADGAVSARGAATALGKLTWMFAIGFLITSITLTVLARQAAAPSSVTDGVDLTTSETTPQAAVPSGEALLPPSASDTAPAEGSDAGAVAPPRAN